MQKQEKAQTIREKLAECELPFLREQTIAGCEKYGVSLDSAWPPVYPEPEETAKPKKMGQLVQLKIWPEAVRGVPNAFLRSALFAAIQGKTRRYMKGEFLGSLDGVSLKFTGMQLDQSDFDVWAQAAHLARLHPLGNVCHFKANAFLKAIGRANGKKDYDWLDASLTRAVACAVEIKSGSHSYMGSLISESWRDKDTREYKVVLNPTIAALFQADDWTGMQLEQRQMLKGKPLALWLHGFYSTHAKPFPMKVETLRDLSGSTAKHMRNFKIKLREAFADLKAVGIFGTIDDDLVTVIREPSAAQKKHLLIKARKPRQ